MLMIAGTKRNLVLLAIPLVLAMTTAAGAEDPPEHRYAGGTLSQALQEVQSLGLPLIYSSDVVKSWMLVEQEPVSRDPRSILDELLSPHGLEAREGPGGVLFIVRENGAAEATGGIEGVVRAVEDYEPVAAALVQVDGTQVHATTAPDGTFLISGLPPGSYELTVTVPGLQEERFEGVPVTAGQRTRVTLDLALVPTILEELVVTPDRDGSYARGQGSGRLIDDDEIRGTPSVGDDLHRAIAWQPGIASGDRSANLSIRGGEPNEVLVLFDGLELYDPFHLKSFQSFSGIIDSMLVSNAQLFSEAFPVEYGDRMSGVLDLSSDIPSIPGRTLVSSSLVNSRIRTEGAFRERTGHWLISARAWYPDAVVQTMDREDEGFNPSYYDLVGKMEFQLGERTVLSGNFLAARDEVTFTDPAGEEGVDARSGTRYAWLNVKSLWSPSLFSRTVLSVGRVQSDRDGWVLEEPEFSAGVTDDRSFSVIGLSQDWTSRASERLLLKWGLTARWFDSDYRYISQSTVDGEPAETDRVLALDPSGRQLGAYVAGQIQPSSATTLELGLRWDRQSHTEEHQVSPRLSLLRRLGRSTRIRAGWGRYYQSQGIYELQVEDGISDFFPAQLAEHWTVGLEHDFEGGLTFRTDAYLKRMSHPRPRFENLFSPFELLPEFEPDRVRIEPDRAEAKGIDLTLSMNRGGPFSWWASYSRSSIEDETAGRTTPRSWDQPHAFRFRLQYRKQDRWELGLAGTYHTGWPTTPAHAEIVTEPDGSTTFEPVPGPRNDARFPPYHRLDLRVGRHFRLGGGRLTCFAEVTNLYDRDNACCLDDVAFLPQGDGSVRLEHEYGLWMPRVPSFGLIWRFEH